MFLASTGAADLRLTARYTASGTACWSSSNSILQRSSWGAANYDNTFSQFCYGKSYIMHLVVVISEKSLVTIISKEPDN